MSQISRRGCVWVGNLATQKQAAKKGPGEFAPSFVLPSLFLPPLTSCLFLPLEAGIQPLFLLIAPSLVLTCLGVSPSFVLRDNLTLSVAHPTMPTNVLGFWKKSGKPFTDYRLLPGNRSKVKFPHSFSPDR